MTYGYVSLPMACRLYEAGVEMETKKMWATSGSKWELIDRPVPPMVAPHVKQCPASSFTELWEWFPSYVNGSDCQYTLRLGKDIYNNTLIGYVWEAGEEWLVSKEDTNPADALGELALWMVENKKKERK